MDVNISISHQDRRQARLHHDQDPAEPVHGGGRRAAACSSGSGAWRAAQAELGLRRGIAGGGGVAFGVRTSS